MGYNLIHPREQITLIMGRIYRHNMTTTSGGNISIRDERGNIWITPAGYDKGSITWDDVVKINPDGSVKGRHRPSSELPFHRSIYENRPDVRAIIHAHPSALVSFSIVRRVPSIRVIPQAHAVCGRIGFAPYALPGSEELGASISRSFAEGNDCVIMENHGIVCGGGDLLDAFRRFETLEFCARLLIKGTMLGEVRELTEEQCSLFNHQRHHIPEFEHATRTSEEKALRRHICQLAHRAYDQRLMTSTEGVISARLDGDSFLITPSGLDRRLIDVGDVVLVKNLKREAGSRFPSRGVHLHHHIYKQHPGIHAIMSAQAPNATAFSITDKVLNTRTIPESYILLRDIPRFPYGPQFESPESVADYISERNPVVNLENDAILVAGRNLLDAFDRLEVAEFTAQSYIDANLIGGLVAIGDDEIRDLEKKFLGEG